MKRLIKEERFWLFLIVVFGLILRLYKITSPILDLYPVRQELNAMAARNFFRSGINILNPQTDVYGSGNPYFALQFPLTEILSAICYHLFGIKEWVGRLVSILFSIGSIILLYKIVKLLFGWLTALFAAFLFAVSPLGIYFSRTFMSESPMIFFSLGIVLSSYRWLAEGKKVWFFVCVISSIFAFLTKIPTIYMLSVVIYLAYLRDGHKFIIKKDFLLFLILSLLPALLWYSLRMSEPMFRHVTPIPTMIRYLMWNKFYFRVFECFSIFILTPIGIPLFTLGFLIKPKKLEQGLVYVWFAALLFYLFRTPDVNSFHYYYQLPFVPVVCIFVARSLSKTFEQDFWRQTIFYRANYRLIVFVICILITLSSIISIRPFYKWNPVTYNVGKFIKANTSKDALLIAGRCTQEGPLYYTDRKGWIINEDGVISYVEFYKGDDFSGIRNKNEIELIEFLIARGADYYFTTNMTAFKSSKILEDYMRSQFEVFKESEGYIIFNLNKRKRST